MNTSVVGKYREYPSMPSVYIVGDMLGIVSLDFLDHDSCTITYTDDNGITGEEGFFYTYQDERHIFMSKVTEKNFIFHDTIDGALEKVKFKFVLLINAVI